MTYKEELYLELDIFFTISIQGRITQQERRSLLMSGYGFDCNCEVCSLPYNLLEQDDKLRVEAFNLSQTCFDLKDSLSSEEMSNVLRTAERWFFLRKMLGYKVGYKVYNNISFKESIVES